MSKTSNYLIVGEDPYIRGREEERLRDKFLSLQEVDLNYSVHAPDDMDRIMDSLGTMPFLSDRRVVLVKGAEVMSDPSLKSMLAYLEKPALTSVLVLSADSSFRKNKSFSKFSSLTEVIKADTPDETTMKKWIRSFFKKENVDISQGAVDLILELKGTDVQGVKVELEKLLAFSSGERILEEHVGKLIGRSVTETVFKLVDAINSKDSGWSLRILEDLYDQKKPPQEIIGYLSWYTRIVQKIKLLASRGVDPSRMAGELGYSPAYTRRLEDQSRKISRKRLKKWLDLLVSSDRDLKTTSGKKPPLVMEMLVVGMINS